MATRQFAGPTAARRGGASSVSSFFCCFVVLIESGMPEQFDFCYTIINTG